MLEEIILSIPCQNLSLSLAKVTAYECLLWVTQQVGPAEYRVHPSVWSELCTDLPKDEHREELNM